MASQGPSNTHSAAQAPGQAQTRRDEQLNRPSDIHNQGSNFLEETGTQVKNMAQGAADIGKGAAQGAINLVRGAAAGAANVASGAADAVNNTLGVKSANNTSTASHPGGSAPSNNPTSTDHPSNPSTRI